ncbi:MAG: response regulator [Eubacteriales bacterium]|nr:response regulator [Eubacteriales bacterium]
MYSLLVIDDEQYAVDGVTQAIDWASEGITSVYGANSAEEAREILEQHPIHVIVCDIEMAEESGLDFLKWLREEGHTAKLIFLTAYARFEYAKESVALGAAEYLIKPVDHAVLRETVADALESWKEEAKRQSQLRDYETICAKLSKEELKKLLDPFQDQPELIPEPLSNNLILRVKEYIDQNIEGDLNRETIAGQVFLNASYLSRLFRKETGEKLSDYIVRVRMEHAKELLAQTGEKVTFIAQRLGYSNDSYFIKTFRSSVGMTPHEYRKRSRKKEREEIGDAGTLP